MKKVSCSLFVSLVVCLVVASVSFSQCYAGGFTTKDKESVELKATVADKASDEEAKVSQEVSESLEVIKETAEDAVGKVEDTKSE